MTDPAPAEVSANNTGELPYVDEHRITIAASRDVVWPALREYVDSSLVTRENALLSQLLGTQPRAGFQIAQELLGQRINLTGRHRFARYLLMFELAQTVHGSTVLTARTFAAFPGLHGRVYRALVISTPAHGVAVRRMLRSVKRSSLRPTRRLGSG
jgi:hypothetical protein